MAKRAASAPTRRASKPPPSQKSARDSLENLATGLGTAKDKMTGVNWVMPDMDQAQADAAYRGDWIARKLIDIPAEDATREWRSWQAGDPEEITAIEAEEQRLGLQQKMKS